MFLKRQIKNQAQLKHGLIKAVCDQRTLLYNSLQKWRVAKEKKKKNYFTYATLGSGVVQWSAQKTAIPRVEGSNPGRSSFFYSFQALARRNVRLRIVSRKEETRQKKAGAAR